MLVALRAGLIAALCFVAFTPASSAEKSFKNSSLDNAAITLEAEVQDQAGAIEKPVTALKKDADTDLKNGNLEGAVDIYTEIVAVAPDDAQAWRRLANILIAIPPTENDDGSTRYERATTAAYIAYQKATTPKDEVRRSDHTRFGLRQAERLAPGAECIEARAGAERDPGPQSHLRPASRKIWIPRFRFQRGLRRCFAARLFPIHRAPAEARRLLSVRRRARPRQARALHRRRAALR